MGQRVGEKGETERAKERNRRANTEISKERQTDR